MRFSTPWRLIPFVVLIALIEVAPSRATDEGEGTVPPSTLPIEQEMLGRVPSNASKIAYLYIPRLSNRVWGVPIFSGTTESELARGIGHFTSSAPPGGEGNFSLFGHRTTHLKPFFGINVLRTGDEVIVETADTWYVYTLRVDKIVRPTDVWVASNARYAPLGIPRGKKYRVLTLISCEPRFSTETRWVWWGELSAELPKGTMPPSLVVPTVRPIFVARIEASPQRS